MSCRNSAMDYLARREHSRLELTRKLLQKNFTQQEVDATLDQLEEEHLLDDHRFAESYTQSRVNRGFGPVRIKQELLERGITETQAGEALSAWDDDWCRLAAEQQRKKYRRPAHDYSERVKQARFLQYRGFTSEQIWQLFEDRDR